MGRKYRGPLRRRQGKRDPLPLIAIFCEGKTESRCLERLRGYWRLKSVTVEVVGAVGEPPTIVNKAKSRRDSLKRGETLEIWVVFDEDGRDSWSSSIDQALALGFGLGISNPCIELWGLLLHGEQNAEIHRHAAQRNLRYVHPGYHHEKNPYFDLATVIKHVDEARERSQRLLKQAESDNDPFKNPTTRFHCLVQRLRELCD